MRPRVAWIDEERAVALGREMGIFERQARRGAFRTMANNPALAKASYDMLMILLSKNSLPLRLREMIVMRIGWRTRSAYQWYQHYQICTSQAGFSDEDVLAIRDWRNPAHATRFQPADRAMLAAVDDTIDLGGISDEVWAQCAQYVREPSVQVEMVMAIGYWIMLSQFFQTFQVPLQYGAAPWPPDGKAPPARG